MRDRINRPVSPIIVTVVLLVVAQGASGGPPDQRNRVAPPQPSGPVIDTSRFVDGDNPTTTSATVDEIEITQGIQDTTQAVQIVIGRRTFVRVSFDVVTALGYGQQSGSIVVIPADGTLNSVAATRSISNLDQWNGDIQLKRNWVNLSLVFELPPNLVQAGALTVRLDKVLDMYNNSASVTCANCATVSRTVPVATTAPFRLTVLGLSYTKGGTTYTPRQLDYDLIPSWMIRAYPINGITYNTRVVASTNPWPFTCTDANTQVALVRANDVNGGVDARTHYYGLVYDGGGFMRGCAASIPAIPNPAAVASGPTGAGTWGWDFDGSYGDWYTAHEVGHTLGRMHVGGVCGEVGIDPNYPFTGGQLSSGAFTFVGFDAGDPTYSIARAAYPGKTSNTPNTPVTIGHDVMSYCSNQWVSSYTYTNIMNRVIAENGLAPGPVPVGATAAAVPEPVLHGRMLHVLAQVGSGWSTGKIIAVTPVTRATVNSAPPADTPIVETIGAQGEVLNRYPVSVFQFTDQDDATSAARQAGLINAAIPGDDSVAGIRITYAGRTLDQRIGGRGRPTLQPFAVKKVAGPGRLTLSPGEPPTEITWTGVHPENKPLTYTVLVSTDGGVTWETIAAGLTTPRVMIGPEHLSSERRLKALGDQSIQFKIIASDGFHTTEEVGTLR